MQKKSGTSKKETNIKVGKVSRVSGNVNIAGGDITTHHAANGLSAADIKHLFDRLYTSIDTHANVSTATEEALKAEVKEI